MIKRTERAFILARFFDFPKKKENVQKKRRAIYSFAEGEGGDGEGKFYRRNASFFIRKKCTTTQLLNFFGEGKGWDMKRKM